MVAGVAGEALDPSIVVVLGVANLLADGFSMRMSNFLSQRSERQYRAVVGADAVSREAAKPPARTAFATFVAFVLAGWTPLAPYVLGLESLFELSVVATAVAFFAVGASRSLVTRQNWLRAGPEMLAVGLLAAGVAYQTGAVLGGLT